MILRIWHLSDAPQPNQIGTLYLHGLVEEWMAERIKHIPEREWEAPDLGVTDAAGATVFIAAYGLYKVNYCEVEGQGRLGAYPRPMHFVGMATKMVTVVQAEPLQVETRTDPVTGVQYALAPPLSTNWNTPKTELRLRGLVVDSQKLEDTITHVEGSLIGPDAHGKIDLML